MITLTTELLQVSVAGVGGGAPEAPALDEDEEQKHLLKDYVAGDIVMAYFEKDNNFQPAEIDAVTSEGNFAITWLGFPSSSAEVLSAPTPAGPSLQMRSKRRHREALHMYYCGCPPSVRRALCGGETGAGVDHIESMLGTRKHSLPLSRGVC